MRRGAFWNELRERQGRRGFAVLLASLAIICVCLGASIARFAGWWAVAPAQVDLTVTVGSDETVPTATATPSSSVAQEGSPESTPVVTSPTPNLTRTVSPDATATPTSLPAVPGCEDLLQAREERSASAWADYTDGMVGLWVTGWAANLTDVGAFDEALGGHVVRLAVIEDCNLVYTEKGEEAAAALVKGQTIRVTGQIEEVSVLLSSMTLHLLSESVVLALGEPPETEVAPALLDMTYAEFREGYADMTDAQREAFRDEIVGLRVRWTASVDRVGANDRVLLDGRDEPELLWVYLDGVPSTMSANLEPGVVLAFEARIAETGSGPADVGLAVFLEYVASVE